MLLPETMRAIVVDQPGGPEAMRLATIPLPRPGPGEVLLRVFAAGVNRPDLLQRQGRYPPPSGASPLLGLEVAGEIVAKGPETSGIVLGRPVAALVNGGGYAEYVAVPAAQCLPWPEGTDAIAACALPETFFTVWANLFRAGRLAAEESVLVHGGGSGIGTTAIQLARAFGARVFATAGSAEKCAACERLGATAINYRTADFAEAIVRLTTGEGVNAVLDIIGAAYFERNLRVLKRDGRLIVIATLGGAVAHDLDLGQVMARRLWITGSTMRPRSTAEKGEIARDLEAKVWPLIAAGCVRPVIHATFGLAQAAEAHKLMESGAHIGKIVLRVAA